MVFSSRLRYGPLALTYAGMSVADFFCRFPDEQACLEHIFRVKFGDHSPCVRCGLIGRWSHIKDTKKYLHTCRKQISNLEGTPFYRSNLSLMAWFYAILLFANSSTGMRSSFLRRQMGIGVKSAHRMCNTIRAHMASFEPRRQIGGADKIVHVDEALIRAVGGGHAQHIVMGMECEGEIICGLLADRSLSSIRQAIINLVRPGSVVVTDCHLSYSFLASEGWNHISINHSRAFHNFAGQTNNPIEAFWAVLKRTMRLYQRVAPHNMWRFLAEIQFRYNRRKAATSPFFELISDFSPCKEDDGHALRRTFDWSQF